MVNDWDTKSVKGLMQMHQAVVLDNQLMVRAMSCFQPCCFRDGEFTPTCKDWKMTGVHGDGPPSDEEDREWDSEDDEPVAIFLRRQRNKFATPLSSSDEDDNMHATVDKDKNTI